MVSDQVLVLNKKRSTLLKKKLHLFAQRCLILEMSSPNNSTSFGFSLRYD